MEIAASSIVSLPDAAAICAQLSFVDMYAFFIIFIAC